MLAEESILKMENFKNFNEQLGYKVKNVGNKSVGFSTKSIHTGKNLSEW